VLRLELKLGAGKEERLSGSPIYLEEKMLPEVITSELVTRLR
jgi:hypothetical protein